MIWEPGVAMVDRSSVLQTAMRPSLSLSLIGTHTKTHMVASSPSSSRTRRCDRGILYNETMTLLTQGAEASRPSVMIRSPRMSTNAYPSGRDESRNKTGCRMQTYAPVSLIKLRAHIVRACPSESKRRLRERREVVSLLLLALRCKH